MMALNRRRLVPGLVFLLIFGIQMYFGREVTEPYMLPDEFGYMAAAAYLNGDNWSPLVAWGAFYHSGFSMLIAPLFTWFSDFRQIYRGVITLNALLGSGIFLLVFSVARRLRPDISVLNLVLVALLISVYPSVLAYSKLALAETLFVFLYWSGLLVLISGCFPNRSRLASFGTGALLSAPYLVHPRGIGLAATAVLVGLILRLRNRLKTNDLIVFLMGLASSLVLAHFMQDFFLTHLWLRNPQEAVGPTNTLSQMTSNSFWKVLFSGAGFERLILTMLGQLFYVGSTTLGLSLIGLSLCGAALKASLLRSIPQEDVPREVVMLQALFSFLAVFSISVLFCFRSERGDGFLYGRYNEGVLGPLLLLGAIWVLDRRKRGLACFVTSALVLLAVGLFLHPKLQAAWQSRSMHLSHILVYFPFRTPNWRVDLGTILQVLAMSLAVAALLLRTLPRVLLLSLAVGYLWVTHIVIEKNIGSSSRNRANAFAIPDWLRQSDPNAPVQFHVQGYDDQRAAERYQMRLLRQQVVPFRKEPPLQGEGYVISKLETLEQAFPSALLASVDSQRRYGLLVLSGSLRQRLESVGTPLYAPSMLLAHLDANDPLPREAYRSRLVLVSSDPAQEIGLDSHPGLSERWFKDAPFLELEVTNLSDSPWPTGRDVPQRVQLAMFWVKSDSIHKWLGEHRVQLPWPMLPHSPQRVKVPLDFLRTPPQALPPGDYALKISLFQEKNDWFWKSGDPILTLRLKVR